MPQSRQGSPLTSITETISTSVPKIIAHRGASVDFRELSYEAYVGAIAQNADGFECDIRLTRDNHLALWHDADMFRLAHRKEKVASLTLQQMQSIAPTMVLEQLFHMAINAKKDLFLETKHPVPTAGKVERELFAYLENNRELIEKSGIRVHVMSFSRRAVRKMNQTPWITIELIKEHRRAIRSTSHNLGIGLFLVKEKPSLIDDLQAKGKKLHVWTVDDADDARWLQSKGVDSIITNRPAYIRQHLTSL